jgi:hypothetical protein
VFQRQVQVACLDGSPAAAGFMNRLFNTLNWCLTEFAVIITDVYDHPSRWTQHSYLQVTRCAHSHPSLPSACCLWPRTNKRTRASTALKGVCWALARGAASHSRGQVHSRSC